MKLAIVGGRDFTDYKLVEDTISNFFCFTDIMDIVSGGAEGADNMAYNFAINNKIHLIVYKPEWAKYGKSAGFLRNQTIVDICDVVLAFWNGESRGTADTIEKAKIAKKPTIIIYY